MRPVAKSDLSTGNARFASYCLQSGNLRFVFTAPYADADAATAAGAAPVSGLEGEAGPPPEAKAAAAAVAGGGKDPVSVNPGFDATHAAAFFRRHGVAARAIGGCVC